MSSPICLNASAFLHVCGGVSISTRLSVASTCFSPRMWRCFLSGGDKRISGVLFSTYVEVFPGPGISPGAFLPFLHVCGGVSKVVFRLPSCQTFLHVCGGVSRQTQVVYLHSAFSPRMWRCFHLACMFAPCAHFSPRMWRCFANGLGEGINATLFSTYVEVFPWLLLGFLRWIAFLHVCGGVSKYVFAGRASNSFSPRMWRCF